MKTLPSSEAEAMRRSLKGFLRWTRQRLAWQCADSQCGTLLGTRPEIFQREDQIPISVENGGCVATEQRDLVGELATFVEGDDGKSTTTRRLPIDGEVFRVDLLCA